MIRNRSGQGHIEEQILDPDLSLRKRFIKAKTVLFKQLLILFIDHALLLRAGINEFIAEQLSGQNRDRDLILLKDQEHGACRVFVPSGRKLDRSAHDPVRIQQIVQLVIEVRDVVGDLPAADVHAAKDRVDRVFGLYAVALQHCLEFPAHDGSGHLQKGIFKQFLVI